MPENFRTRQHEQAGHVAATMASLKYIGDYAMIDVKTTMDMTIGDQVRATYPYGGVPACDGTIIKELTLGHHLTQFLVSFETRAGVFKTFYLTERELTLCSVQEIQEA